MRSCSFVMGVLFFLVSPAVFSAEQLPVQFTIGVVPQQPTARAVAQWAPLLSHIRATTGIDVRFETAKDIPTFELRLASGAYDFAYMNPYHYVTFSNSYVVMAHEERKIQGILLVRKDSKYRKISDLHGETIAFPAPVSFAATVLIKAELRMLGIKHRSEYVGSHNSVYESVSMGLFAAGGGIQSTLDNHPVVTTNNLRVLMRTSYFTPHAFAAHKRISPAVVTKVRTSLLAMHRTPEGRALLEELGFSPLVIASDNDYDDIRVLDLNLLRHLTSSP